MIIRDWFIPWCLLLILIGYLLLYTGANEPSIKNLKLMGLSVLALIISIIIGSVITYAIFNCCTSNNIIILKQKSTN